VRRSEVRCLKAEDEAEAAQIIFRNAVGICAQRVEQVCKAYRTRLNQRWKATAQRAQPSARRNGIEVAQETSDTEAGTARTTRRTPGEWIHAANPRRIGEPLKVVPTPNLNLTATLRSTRDGRCGGEGVCNARGESCVAACHDQWHASICK